jgi:hypothetical protein
LLSEYLREYVGKNVEKPEYPSPFSLSFSLSGFAAPLPVVSHFKWHEKEGKFLE